MKKSIVIIIVLSLFAVVNLKAQSTTLYRDTSIQVFNGTTHLVNAWAGGFNAPVFAKIDLNGDGIMDLAVFDAQGYRLSTFINRGTPSSVDYIYAPEYEKRFPPNLEGWIRTYDYDKDGNMDLFSYTNASINVFHNNYTAQNGLQFSLVSNQLNTYYGTFQSNIYVSRVDMPAFIDDDGDGDMDILSLDIGQGYIHHEKNLSEDSLHVGNQFLFHDIDGCWGYFSFNINENYAYLDTSSFNTCNLNLPAKPFEINSQTRHNGSATWALDMDGDGDMDLLFGSIHGANLLYLKNCGTPDSAYMCSQDTLFPNYATVDGTMDTIASPYYIDVNNDGNNDLIVADFGAPGEDFHNVKYYRNTTNNSSNVFSFVTDRFLVDNMIEVGTGAHPSLVDIDGDGLKDLLIADDYYFNRNGPNFGKIMYYHNSGTATAPKFTLVSDDFAGLSADSLKGIYLTFGDLDNDGDLDMIVGLNTGKLDYFQNNGGVYTLIQTNYQSIAVSSVSAIPQLVDVDRDGLLDLLIGERAGNINYYKNTGTVTAPVFTFVTDTFGGILVRKWNATVGFSVPLLYDHNGSYELLVGSQSGYIYHYNNIDGNLSGNFNLVDSMFQNIYEPQYATPAMADLDGDGKFDLVVGNIEGGVTYYSQNSALAVGENTSADLLFTLYPNPANEVLNINIGNLTEHQKAKATIYDVLGKQILNEESLQTMLHLDLRGFTPGISVQLQLETVRLVKDL